MPSSVGSASKALSASSNGDQVDGSLLLAFLPFGCFGIFVHDPSRKPCWKVAHWSRPRRGAGKASTLSVERGGRGGAIVLTAPSVYRPGGGCRSRDPGPSGAGGQANGGSPP